MTTLFITHPICLEHEPNDGHPECPDRLRVVFEAAQAIKELQHELAPRATKDDLTLAHTAEHIERVFSAIPSWGLNFIDPDTAVSPKSGEAALHAVGAVLKAVDDVVHEKADNAFCAVRPPGHHAGHDFPHGFCLFNNIAIGAIAAIEHYGLKRVAIIDFDVHHGDGTQDIVWNRSDLFYASTHQWPLFPGTGLSDEKGAHDNITNVPLPAGTDGQKILSVLRDTILPRVTEFHPDLIMVSAGFDAHKDDPIGGMLLTDEDFGRIMSEIVKTAGKSCNGRLVAVLEGGYNLEALKASTTAVLRALMQKG